MSSTEEHSISLTIRAISFVFLINFINIYSQIELLWGKQGILSVDYLFSIYNDISKNNTNITKTLYPSIVPLLHNKFNISGESCLYIMSLLGTAISFLMLISKKFHKAIFMFLIWVFYLNIFLVGQNFMSFGFDHFNLEVGFISIFLCEFTLFDSKYLQIMSKYILKFTIFKILYSFGLSLIFSNNQKIQSLQGYDSFLMKQSIPSSTIIFLLKYFPIEFHSFFISLTYFTLFIIPFGMFCFIKRISKISGIFIMILCVSLTFLGNIGLGNLMLLAINFVNFDDEFLDLLFRFGQEKTIQLKDGRNVVIPNGEELSTSIGIDIFITCIISFISLMLIFPINKIATGNFDLSPGRMNNPYKFLKMDYLKYAIVLFIICIIAMAIIEYYYKYIKDKEYNKNSTILKLIIFTILGIVYLSHSIDGFYSGLNLPMIIKRKGSILYNTSHNIFNTLHKYKISSGYGINKGFLDEKNHQGRDILVLKYQTEIYVPIESNKTKINATNNLNETNTNNTNINKTNIINNDTINNGTEINKTKSFKKKLEWKSVNFKHQLDEKNLRNNLCFFISLLFRQPRLEYALHILAYEEKNRIEKLNEKIWIPHLIYRLFNDKIMKGNITKVKIEKIRYTFSRYSDKNFKTTTLSKYLNDINLSEIEEFLTKYKSFIVKKELNKNMLGQIPLHLIIFSLLLIILVQKINPFKAKEKEN